MQGVTDECVISVPNPFCSCPNELSGLRNQVEKAPQRTLTDYSTVLPPSQVSGGRFLQGNFLDLRGAEQVKSLPPPGELSLLLAHVTSLVQVWQMSHTPHSLHAWGTAHIHDQLVGYLSGLHQYGSLHGTVGMQLEEGEHTVIVIDFPLYSFFHGGAGGVRCLRHRASAHSAINMGHLYR